MKTQYVPNIVTTDGLYIAARKLYNVNSLYLNLITRKWQSELTPMCKTTSPPLLDDIMQELGPTIYLGDEDIA